MKRRAKALIAALLAFGLLIPGVGGLRAPVAQADPPGLAVQDLTGRAPEDLVAALVGPGVTYSNVSFSGVNRSAGTFTGGAAVFGDIDFENGILLSSGSVHHVVGPNEEDSISASNGAPGDADLNGLIPGYQTYDATVLEFDFVPIEETMRFRFVFGSEEYNEYVGSTFNDVFGVFVNGVNATTIPGTTTAVAINTVNSASNPHLFINNDLSDGGGAYNTEMDGFTVVMEIEVAVLAGQSNHIKLAIADAGDATYDSALLLAGLGSGTLDTQPPTWPAGTQLGITLLCTSVALSWPAATDDSGEVQYRVLVDGLVHASTSDTAVQLDLSPNTTYGLEVQAGDNSGNWSIPGLAGTVTTTDPASGNPALTWIAPETTDQISDGEDYLIQFFWGECCQAVEDTSVTIRIRDAQTNTLIAGYTWGYQIGMDAGGVYSQLFRSSQYDVSPGQSLKVMVYFGNKLRSTAYLQIQ